MTCTRPPYTTTSTTITTGATSTTGTTSTTTSSTYYYSTVTIQTHHSSYQNHSVSRGSSLIAGSTYGICMYVGILDIHNRNYPKEVEHGGKA